MPAVYEDKLVTLSLSPTPLAKGHLIVKPNKTFSCLQDLDDKLCEHIFFVASYAATALFELAGAQGTNIITTEDPFSIHVIARTQDDGLDFLWQPTSADPKSLAELAKSIKDKLDLSDWKEKQPEKKPVAKTEIKSDEHNFLFKSLQRVP